MEEVGPGHTQVGSGVLELHKGGSGQAEAEGLAHGSSTLVEEDNEGHASMTGVVGSRSDALEVGSQVLVDQMAAEAVEDSRIGRRGADTRSWHSVTHNEDREDSCSLADEGEARSLQRDGPAWVEE